MIILRKLGNFLLFIERSSVVALLGAMVLLAFTQVILRNVFSTGFLWADTLLRHMVLWAGFVGASLATEEERHIAIDVLSRFLPERYKHLTRIFTFFFAAVICFILGDAALTFVLSEKEAGSVLLIFGSTEVLTWHAELIIPIGFGMMCLRFLLRIAEHIAEFFGKQPAVSPRKSKGN